MTSIPRFCTASGVIHSFYTSGMDVRVSRFFEVCGGFGAQSGVRQLKFIVKVANNIFGKIIT